MPICRAKFPKSPPGCAAPSWLLLALLVASEIASPQTPTVVHYPVPTTSQLGGITAGPDGALWFTETLPSPGGTIPTGKIGRVTTAGTITEYSIPDMKYFGAVSITTGPDGALWFTELQGVGRITTSGSIAQWPLFTYGQTFGNIVVGPDGALWFTGYTGFGGSWVGKIATTGSVTIYPILATHFPALNAIGVSGITKGADGALWFVANQEIGRITTSGAVTYYGAPNVNYPVGIVSGPDGSLWFGEDGSISTPSGAPPVSLGRISTTGTLSEFGSDLLPYAGVFELTVGPDNALYSSNQSFDGTITNLIRIDVSGVPSFHVYTFSTSTASVGHIAWGPDGAMWFTDSSSIGRLSITSPSIMTTPLPMGVVGVPYSQTLSATAEFGPITWSATNLPSWLTLDSTKGSLTGTPPAAGSFGFTNTVTDSLGLAASKMLTVSVVDAPASVSVISGNNQSGTVGKPLSQKLTVKVTDGIGNAFAGAAVTFAVASGSATINPTSAQSGSDGTASTSVTLGNTAGPATITASVKGLAPVTFAITATTDTSPQIFQSGVVSAGLSTPTVQVASPNAILSIFGQNFAPAGTTHKVSVADLVNGLVPTNLLGVCVVFGDQRAPIFLVTPGQLNIQAPALPASGTVTVQVLTNCDSTGQAPSNPVA